MTDPKDYGSIGIIIRTGDDGTVSRLSEADMKRPIAVMKNTSTKKRWAQNIGTKTDVLMAPGSSIPITMEDEIAGVPLEIKGTGIKKMSYKPEDHNKPHPMSGGAPGMQPVDARDSLPEDHPARKEMDNFERELGRPLCGKGTKKEVHRILDDAKDIAKKGGA